MNRILKSCAVVAIVTLLLPLLTWAKDHPLKKAKVGEWIEFVTSSASMGQKMEIKTKQTVVAKDDISVTLRMVTTMMGKEQPPRDIKIMLDKPYEPFAQGLPDAVVTTLGEGNETITVGGKSYDCHWVKAKVVATKPMAMESTTKFWSSKDVPVNGMVRMESEAVMTIDGKARNSTTSMQLTGSGR